ncbi:EF-hand domain-containing protein [Candidatus Methylobacter oryzae]|nr:EF-hand domain-containing protein [Candidatus Methylobacter oryzae]
MSISSINSSSPAMAMRGMHRPDPAKMADDLFSKLDTSGKGYIEKSDLQSALSQLSKSDSSNSSSNSSAADDMFAKMDSDGNGKVTKEEMSATIEKIAAKLDGPFPRMRMQDSQGEQRDMPPGGMPPPQGGDQGLSKDQLTSMSKELSSTNSERSKVISDVAANFDTVDTNGDGKVSASEARAFEKSKNSSGAGSSTDQSSTASSSSSDAQFMKQMMHLLKSYGGINQAAENNNFSASA